MRLPVPLDDAWRALLALPAQRGELAGFTGTAVLEEADDDVHVAVFRLQGTSGVAAATARLTTALAPASDGTSLAFELDLHPGPGAEITREDVLRALEAAAPAALAAAPAIATPDEPPPSPAAVTPAPASPPTWSADVDWVEPNTASRHPAPPASSSRKVALVAAGAAAALLAARALRRGS